nr:hypothetical protein [Tanacetum cinerariifolium]
MSGPFSPDRVFDFPVDEPEPHPAYDFFAPGPLPGYAGNPNNNNKWIETNVPLLRELGVVLDEAMFDPIVDEIAQPIVEAEEQFIEDLSTRLGNLEYEHGPLVKKVIQVSDAEVAAGISIGEIDPRVFAIEGQVQ